MDLHGMNLTGAIISYGQLDHTDLSVRIGCGEFRLGASDYRQPERGDALRRPICTGGRVSGARFRPVSAATLYFDRQLPDWRPARHPEPGRPTIDGLGTSPGRNPCGATFSMPPLAIPRHARGDGIDTHRRCSLAKYDHGDGSINTLALLVGDLS